MEQHGYVNWLSAANVNGTFYNAGLYCRLSKDDDAAGDSTSIQTQKMLAEKFCADNQIRIQDFYIDDGYSGANFNRPGFIQLIKDIEAGKINCVIVKDLSRLGRDYIQTGYYTEIFFVSKRVRFIAINDNIDSIKADNDIAPFKNILNDMYIKDMSRKIKSAKRQRMQKGMFISGQAPYGYRKNPANINQLIIDDEAAEVVKLIFDLALGGMGANSIVRELTLRKIMIPSAYKALHGDTRFEHYCRDKEPSYKHTWCIQTVKSIIENMVYAGDMENGKVEVISYKTKERKKVPKNKRIVVRNTHEPIVEREVFERVQVLIKARQRPHKTYNNDNNVFRGLIFCAECGHRMTFTAKTIPAGRKRYMRCQVHYVRPDFCSKPHNIPFNKLYEIVQQNLKKLFASFMNGDEIIDAVQRKGEAGRRTERLIAEKARNEQRMATLTRLVVKLYEDHVSGILDSYNYQVVLNNYQQEQKALAARAEALDLELANQNDITANTAKLKEIALKFMACEELTKEMLNQLIEKIVVGEKRETDNGFEQEIHIVYRFINTTID